MNHSIYKSNHKASLSNNVMATLFYICQIAVSCNYSYEDLHNFYLKSCNCIRIYYYIILGDFPSLTFSLKKPETFYFIKLFIFLSSMNPVAPTVLVKLLTKVANVEAGKVSGQCCGQNHSKEIVLNDLRAIATIDLKGLKVL